MNFYHVSVLLEETVQALAPRRGGRYIDGTLGGGGHAEAVLERSAPDGMLLGLDQDETALAAAGRRLARFGARVRLRHGNFARMAEVAAEEGFTGADGVLFDLGVSSPQLDVAERGFSYQHDAPLDMRMDRTQPTSAADLVNQLPEEELARIIREYGEERWAKRIAQFIVQRRQKQPIETTGELVDLIKAAVPAAARRAGPHPAKRTFQALRIAVNDELGALQKGLQAAVRVLRPGGRIAVISFHSLEDRICKETFAALARGCVCPPELPVCTCGSKPELKILTRRPVTASLQELERNPRARSAKLRVAEKI